MNVNAALERMEAKLITATEKAYLYKLNKNDKEKLRDAILSMKDALAVAENLEENVYQVEEDA